MKITILAVGTRGDAQTRISPRVGSILSGQPDLPVQVAQTDGRNSPQVHIYTSMPG